MTEKRPSAKTTSEQTQAEPQSYGAAEDELEAILAAIEDEDVDVDQLSTKVARARTLITWCRERLASAELQVTELLADTDD